MPPRMFATLLETAGNPAPKPGDLVLIEVPLNCTIHSRDASRLSRLREFAAVLAKSIGRYDPVNVLSHGASVLFEELLELGAADTAMNALLDAVGAGESELSR